MDTLRFICQWCGADMEKDKRHRGEPEDFFVFGPCPAMPKELLTPIKLDIKKMAREYTRWSAGPAIVKVKE